MNEVAKAKKCAMHPLSKDFSNFPYSQKYEEDKVDAFMLLVETLLFNLFDIKFANMGARFGIERVIDLVGENYNRETAKLDTKHGDYRKDFSLGDNNDGIIIVDAVENKYCFMDIGCCSTLENLPSFTPLTAKEYVEAYYPTSLKVLIKTDETKDLKANIRKVKFVEKVFKKFNLLSVEDVKEMFPKVKQMENS